MADVSEVKQESRALSLALLGAMGLFAWVLSFVTSPLLAVAFSSWIPLILGPVYFKSRKAMQEPYRKKLKKPSQEGF